MKIKFNWGTAIVIAMISFMIFILQFVYKTLAVDKYEHHLVSEDYYKDELYYQQEIDKLKNANNLEENVTVERTTEGFLITFPKNLELNKITGEVIIQRNSDKRLDFKEQLNLTDNTMLINNKKLASGKYLIKIDWKLDDKEYLFKENIFY
ncbi:MAG: cytochrome C oxidase Cbb3 [Flavobacteriales bacterium]|nr:MAG: cytochrome C oxidase Cbb3 [Flavobacteriales bacterium]PIE49750.1 MAG: cytochrome C oxidase Cbb3 [Flavobacteriales bacterium]